MIEIASKYGGVRTPKAKGAARRPAPAAPQILIPTAATRVTLLRDYWWKEIKEGGFLHEYVRREKGTMGASIRRVARFMSGFKPNHKSDFRLVARVPARLAQRLKAEDPDFFSDDRNLKNLKRDNPDVCVYL